jgi:hypothetical protein
MTKMHDKRKRRRRTQMTFRAVKLGLQFYNTSVGHIECTDNVTIGATDPGTVGT